MIKFTLYHPEPQFYVEYEYLERLARERNIDALMSIYDRAIHYLQSNKLLKFYKNGKFQIEATSKLFLPTYFEKLPIRFEEQDFPLKQLFPHFLNENISIKERIKVFRSKLLKPEFNEKISYKSTSNVSYTVYTILEKIVLEIGEQTFFVKTYFNCWTLHSESLVKIGGLSSEEFQATHRYFQTITADIPNKL